MSTPFSGIVSVTERSDRERVAAGECHLAVSRFNSETKRVHQTLSNPNPMNAGFQKNHPEP